MRGGKRKGSGRKSLEGERHTYTVTSECHKYIMAHGQGKCIIEWYKKEVGN